MFKQKTQKYIKKDLFKIAHKGTKWLLFGVVFASLIGAGIGIGTPIISQKLIDIYIPNKDISMIIWMIASMVFLLLLKLVSTYIFSYFGRVLQMKVEFQLRQHSFKHMQKSKVEYIDSKNEGHFLTRINEDAANISQIIRYIPDNLLSGLVTSISAFTMVFLYNIYLGIILFGIFIALLGFTFLLRNSFFKAWMKVRRVSEITNMSLVNSVSGIKESKIFLAEDNEIKKFGESLNALSKAWKSNFKVYARWMVFNTMILTSIGIIIIGFGTWQIIVGSMQVGELVAAVMYGGQIVDPINKFLAVFDILVNSKTSITRVLEFWNTDEEQYNEVDKLVVKDAAIEFKNVYFSYAIRSEQEINEFDEIKKKVNKIDNSSVKQKHILNGISFKIEAGEKVAFVGETGSGKSTILKLITKFYEPTEGNILFDKQSIKNVDVHTVRKEIAYLQQDPYMFFDTISNNIKFGMQDKKNFSENEVVEKIKSALHVARASDFVNALPKQIEENVGPRGVSLSGGQKQRLAIARAILKDSKIVLFDEATSALDNVTEKDIQKQIEELIKDKTTIFVAHRLSTIKNLDRIFVLKDGLIVESGTHAELMQQKGYYFNLNKVAE